MELVISNVSKIYRNNKKGLDNFSLKLGKGIIGLLGPNGAGKSTLMRILATVTNPSQGSVMWNNTDVVKNPNDIRRVLGYLPQDFGIYPNLNVVEFLEYLAAIRGIEKKLAKNRIDELLQLFNLTNFTRQPLGSYSGGMKQRVGIAQALLNNPELLIVDEPTVGLDPEERIRFRNLISELCRERIIVLSTHIVSDIEASATEIALIKNGCLLKHSTPEKLLSLVEGNVWECIVTSDKAAELRQNYLISNTVLSNQGMKVRIIATMKPIENAVNVQPTLEDAYLFNISVGKGGGEI